MKKLLNRQVDKLYLNRGLTVALVIATVGAIPRYIRSGDIELINVAYAWVYVAILVFMLWVISMFFITNRCITRMWVKSVFGIGSCFFLSTLFHLLISIAFGLPEMDKPDVIYHMTRKQQVLLALFSGTAFSGMIFFVAYYTVLTDSKQKDQLEIEQLKQENLEARMNLLKQQISPHFLFNSLSTLKTIATDSKTKNYVLQLSNVYRYLLNNNNKTGNLISLKEEVDFTMSYIHILNERFEEALQVSIYIDENKLKGRMLPPLVLQILIENAVKHNVVSLEDPLVIKVYNDEEGCLVVRNNLQPKLSTEESFGIGLQNIRDRYMLLNEKEIEVKTSDTEFIVRVPLLS